MAATDVERLVVSLEASITKYERTMQRAIGVNNKTMRDIEKRQTTMVQRMNSGFAGIQRGVVTAFASAAALRGAAALVDASTRIENSLKVVGLEGEELARVYDRLFQSAQKNMAPLETLTTLYSRLGLAQKELGVTNEQVLSFTDNVALALRVQGTTADEARGALIQLSQAMGSGIVRAEEFNSVVEGAPSILRAAAAGLKEANGSVAQLRKLVIDGKLSSEAFFHAFEAGSVILKDQVANAEMTVSQGFVRLQNVLIDTAGKFDNATNASGRVGGALAELAAWIEQVGNKADENAPAINRFLDWISKAGNDLGNSMFQGTVREFEAIGSAVEQVSAGFDRYGSSVTDAELATAQAEQALVNFAANGASQFGELAPVVQDFIQQLLEGRGTAESAAIAIEEIGNAGDFGGLMSRLGELVDTLFSVRSEAAATAAAVAAAAAGRSSTDNIADQRAEQLGNRPKPPVKPVSLSDYAAPAKPGSGGGGRGGSRQSPGERYTEALADYQRRIDMMNQETAQLAQLNPLINDYGFAIEKLRAQQELENAAKKAGIELGPQQREQIEQLAAGYAQASADAARLAEAQGLLKQNFDDLANAGRQALDTIIDGFLEGKDAGEIFNSVLKDLAKSLLSMGLNLLGGGMQAGGFNPLSFLGGLFGFASGTANTGGARGQPRGVVHGQEAVIPLPAGGKVPVDLRLPDLPQAGGGEMKITVGVAADSAGNLTPFVESVVQSGFGRAAPAIVATAVGQANKSAPGALARHQQQKGGSDYRTM